MKFKSKQINFLSRGISTLDTVGGQNLNTITPTILNFDTIEDANSMYITKLSDSAYRINKSGIYELIFKVSASRQSGGDKNILTALFLDGVVNQKTLTANSGRGNNANREISFSLPPCELDLTALQILTIRSFRVGNGGGQITTLPNTSYFQLRLLN